MVRHSKNPKTKPSSKATSKNKQPLPTASDLQRVSDDITALRTALNMQVSLLVDIERILHLSAKPPVIPKR